MVFNIITNVDPGVPKFIAATTDINPRVRVANTAPLLKPVADWDFLSPEECRRGLTAAEVEVALLLCKGNTAEAIAKTRRVAVGTVRTQIKTILSKVGVRRQAQLAALLIHL